MTNERRRFYRIEDRVYLKAEAVDQADLAGKLEDFWSNPHQRLMRSEFHNRLDESQADFRVIQRDMPELARCLGVLQAQIDRLTEAGVADQAPTQARDIRVNLSAQGISFMTDELFSPADIVELHLQLRPFGDELVILARVVLAEARERSDQPGINGRYRVSMDFEHIHSDDRETLVKHIHRKQLAALNSARSTTD